MMKINFSALFFSLLLFAFFTEGVYAQKRLLRGSVKDNAGIPLSQKKVDRIDPLFLFTLPFVCLA